MVHPKFAIASLSLGSCEHHSLPQKIRVASSLGYEGLEIFFADFEAFVDEVRNGQHADLFPSSQSPFPDVSRREFERACATAISTLCKSHNLEIPVIQPLRNFENFSSRAEIEAAVDEAERWLDLLHYFNSDLLLVCSNFIPGPNPITSGATTMEAYLDTQVEAFRCLGERAKKYNARIGYEPLAWGTVMHRWDQVWEVVRRADMPNVGIILDSFNTLGNQYADPTRQTSIRPGDPLSDVRESLSLLKCSIPGSKIFCYQIADAHRPLQPVEERSDAPARMTWSRASRIFPCEEVPPELSPAAKAANESFEVWKWKHTGFLPVVEMSRVIHDTGYSGWWSLEVFNASLRDSDADCPRRHGERGIKGLGRLWAVMENGKVKSASVKGADGSSSNEKGNVLASVESGVPKNNDIAIAGGEELIHSVNSVPCASTRPTFRKAPWWNTGTLAALWRRLSVSGSSAGRA